MFGLDPSLSPGTVHFWCITSELDQLSRADLFEVCSLCTAYGLLDLQANAFLLKHEFFSGPNIVFDLINFLSETTVSMIFWRI